MTPTPENNQVRRKFVPNDRSAFVFGCILGTLMYCFRPLAKLVGIVGVGNTQTFFFVVVALFVLPLFLVLVRGEQSGSRRNWPSKDERVRVVSSFFGMLVSAAVGEIVSTLCLK
jgi:hypothetical protein